MADTLTYSKATSKEVAQVIKRISDNLHDENEDTIVKACLAIAILLQAPRTPISRVAAGVEGASEWIALWAMDPTQKLVN